MSGGGYDNYGYNNNGGGNGDYNNPPPHHQNDNDQGTKRSFQERGDDDGGHMPHKRMRRQDSRDSRSEMRCLVPSRTAGGIIGKGGSNIKDMRETFNAQIQIPDSKCPERVLNVRASPESCGEIIMRVLPTINGNGDRNQEPVSHSNMQIKLLVHQSQAGGVIGSKGHKIKELREKTGANIKVHQECAGSSTDRICVISGSSDRISQCIVLIMELLVITPPKGAVQNYDPAFDNAGDGGMNDGFGFRGGNFGMNQFGGGRGGRFRGGGGFNGGRGNFRGGNMGGNRGGMGSFRGGRDFGMDRGGGRMDRGGNRGGMRNRGGFNNRNDGGGNFRGGSRGGGMRQGGYENY